MEVVDKHWCSCSLTYKETLKSETQTRNGRLAFKIKVGILAICQANLLHFHLQPMASSYICGLASICRQTERPTGNCSSLLATKAVNRSSTFFATSFNQPQPTMSKNHCQPVREYMFYPHHMRNLNADIQFCEQEGESSWVAPFTRVRVKTDQNWKTQAHQA